MIDKRIIGDEPKSVHIFKIIKRIFNIVITLIFIPILVINLIMLFQTITNPKEIPNFLGYRFFVITSGSMEQTIHTGDFIVIKQTEADKLQKNDIITFKEEQVVITHRIIDITKKQEILQFTTKGDNNNVKDDKTVSADNVLGKYLFTIPFLGKITLFIQQPAGLITIISIPILLTLINHKINETLDNKSIERKNKRITYKK